MATRIWHTISASDAANALTSPSTGLASAEAARRLLEFGPNRLRLRPPTSVLSILVSQFRGVVVYLLIGATVVSFLLGDMVEAAAIAIVLALNGGIGFIIELRARRAMEALQQLGATTASVWRDGTLRVIDAQQVVPGDLVELRAGQTVPADGRVLSEADLRTDEAALTGESLPVSKSADLELEPETPLAERLNMVYQGTTVAAGIGRMVVTATGDATEVGRIGSLTQSLGEEQTPLERRLDELGRRLVWLALGVAAIVGVLGLIHGEPWGLMVKTAIALAVAAVPEGLPAVATITLAVGLHRMSRRSALVRRLPVVEALGSTTVICTDKTRTLTSGVMAVVRVWTPRGERSLVDPNTADDPQVRRVLGTAVRASHVPGVDRDSGQGAGMDPVDLAVTKAARLYGVDASASSAPCTLIPFSSERKLMASICVDGERWRASAKGAPGRIIELCGAIEDNGVERPLEPHVRQDLLSVNRELARRGLRVLAVAEGAVTEANEASLIGLTFVGFIGLMDPPAPGVKEAIAALRRAGLRTIMLTGDQKATAETIGRDLGVISPGDDVIDSRDLRTFTPETLRARLARAGAFSRVTPEDKLTIVRALQARGAIVAMLGDGVNDAPALRKAEVGVAMGIRGTDVAREAAAIVLQNDRFDTIVAAVEEGRVIFDNIRKFVFYLFSCNLAEILVLLVAALVGLPLPLVPLQILWLNMVTDTFPALALAVEPGDADVMERPPRDPQAAILSRPFFWEVLLYASLIAASTLTAYLWALSHAAAHTTTVAFMTLALAQTFHLGNARSPQPVLKPSQVLSNGYALGAVALSVLLLLAALYLEPISGALQLSRLDATEWLVVVACSAIPAVAGQALKLAPVARSRGEAR